MDKDELTQMGAQSGWQMIAGNPRPGQGPTPNPGNEAIVRADPSRAPVVNLEIKKKPIGKWGEKVLGVPYSQDRGRRRDGRAAPWAGPGHPISGLSTLMQENKYRQVFAISA